MAWLPWFILWVWLMGLGMGAMFGLAVGLWSRKD